ncbi:MAG: hypothetical protein U9R53_01600 [Chloroflexota bacterium]|nr:hypothetical protein [Chloroflexota bacterium]
MRERQFSDETLLALERALKAKLNPVHPDQSFIHTLKQRLADMPINEPHQRMAMTLLTIAGGLFLGLVIYLIGRGFIKDKSDG